MMNYLSLMVRYMRHELIALIWKKAMKLYLLKGHLTVSV